MSEAKESPFRPVPMELQAREQWELWGSDDPDAPRQPHWRGDYSISWSDPADWHSFEEAVEAAEKREAWGIGYVTARDNDAVPDGRYGVVDIDGCLDEDGRPKAWLPSLDRFIEAGAYIERSPSGTGLHIPFEGDAPEWWRDCQRGDHEGVDVLTNKFCTFTGEVLDVGGTTVFSGEIEPWLARAYEAVNGEPPETAATRGSEATAFAGSEEWLDAETVRDALGHIDPDVAHPTWIRLAYAVHDFDPGATGRSLFEEWSRRGAKWDRQAEDQVEHIWSDAAPGSGVTVATLIHVAREHGWSLPAEASTAGKSGAEEEPTVETAASRYVAAKEAYEASAKSEKAYAAWEAVLRGEGDLIAAQPSGTIYACHNGVWEPDGKQVLRERARGLMGTDFSKSILDELIEQVRATTPVPIEEMGAPAETIAVKNGLLDLETRDLREIEPEDNVLARLPVAYDPDATCPRWEQFIEESVEAGRRKAIQEYVGYCLMVGELPYARVLLLVGGGSNGKTTFLNVVTELLGTDNTTGYSLGDLVHSEYHVAGMHGAIANIDADVTGGIGYGGMFKKLTGGDRKVAARKPYGEPFDYHPTTKQLYAANEVPDTKVDDDAFFRRWLIVEFPTEFTDPDLAGPDKDPALEETLLGELSGILNWALDGLDRLRSQEHFSNEGTIEDKRRRWRSWGDTVEKFITGCINTEGEGKHRTSEVYTRYKAWCGQHGETPESQSTLTRSIKKLDGVQYSTAFRFDGKQARGFKGFTFTAEAPPPTDGDGDGDGGERAQSRVTQYDAHRRVQEAVREVAADAEDGLAPVEEVLDAVADGIDRDRARHILDDLLADGTLYEPTTGHVRGT